MLHSSADYSPPEARREVRAYNTPYHDVDPDHMVALARHAEDRGFESFYVAEHIVLYPGASVDGVLTPPSLAISDPLECLSFVAAAA